jgi:hypothetical protein
VERPGGANFTHIENAAAKIAAATDIVLQGSGF